MTTQTTSPRFFNPIALWADVALKTSEMLVSAGSVIQIRTQRMATAGLQPSAEDLAEFQLMGQEKIEAVAESGTAIANHLTTVNTSLLTRAVQHWFASAAALVALSTSVTPAQAMGHLQQFIDNAIHSAATVSQLSSTTARIAQRGLKPIHAKATSNARRLALGQA